MQFTLGRPAKVSITIDNTAYSFPMFLGEAFEAEVSRYAKEIMDAALAEYDPKDREGRARFRLMFQVPPVDVVSVTASLKTPKGCDTVIKWCGEHAEPVVPPDVLAQLIRETPVPFKRDLAGVLLGTEVFEDAMRKDSGEPEPLKDGASPLPDGGGQTPPPRPTCDAAPTPPTSIPASSTTPTETTPAS